MRLYQLFLIIACTTLVSSTLIAQKGQDEDIWFEPRRSEVVSYNNGIIPYRKDDKWGFVDSEGKMLVSPRYDSLYFAGVNFCIVKDSNHFTLLNEKLKPLLGGSFPLLEYGTIAELVRIAPVMRVTEKDGVISYLEYQQDSWIPYSPAESHSFYRNADDYIQNDYIDSVFSFQNALVVYPKKRLPQTFYSSKAKSSPRFIKPYFVETNDTLYNLRQGTKAFINFTIETSFTQNDTTWFDCIASTNPPGDHNRWIQSEFGDTLCFRQGWDIDYLYEEPGYMIVQKNSETYRYDILSFPSLRPLATNATCTIPLGGGFYYFEDTTGHFYCMNPFGKTIYSGKGSTCEISYEKKRRAKMPTIGASESNDQINAHGLIYAIYDRPKRKYKNQIISAEGKVLLKTKKDIRFSSYYSEKYTIFELGWYSPHTQTGIYDWQKDSIYIFDYRDIITVNDSVLVAVASKKGKAEYYFIDQRGSQRDSTPYREIYPLPNSLSVELMVCRTVDSTFFLKDKNGSRMNNTIYTTVHQVYWNDSLTCLFLQNAENRANYDLNLKKISLPEGIWITESTKFQGKWLYNVSSSEKPGLTGIMDESQKIVVPIKFKEIQLVGDAYFYVTDQNGKHYYMRPDGTILFEE